MAIKVFFDMDGVLAEFNKNASFEELWEPGYFFNRPAMVNMVEALTMLIESDIGECVYIRSAVLPNGFAAKEKEEWIHKYLPQLSNDHIQFVECGSSKAEGLDFSKNKLFLVDDFSHNLHEWKGVGIKVYNGINGTNQTWKGYAIKSDMTPTVIFRQLYGIIKTEEAFNAA